MVSLQSTVAVAKDAVSAELGSGMVLLNTATGMYCSLNPVGMQIWRLIEKPRQVGEIRDAVTSQYNIASERGERDLLSFLGALEAEGLVEVSQS